MKDCNNYGNLIIKQLMGTCFWVVLLAMDHMQAMLGPNVQLLSFWRRSLTARGVPVFCLQPWMKYFLCT